VTATIWRTCPSCGAGLRAARRPAATSFPHEAAACREKAETPRAKYGL
jgi:hypothetical protein